MRPYEPGKSLHNIIQTAVPDFVEAEYPLFMEFVQSFCSYLEQSRAFANSTVIPEFGTAANNIIKVTTEYGGPVYEARKLLEYRDIQSTLDEFVQYFTGMFAKNFPQFSYVPADLVVRSLRQFYQAKGTTDSIGWFFRTFFNEAADVYFPREDILKTSDGTWEAPITLKVSQPLPDPNTGVTPVNSDVQKFYVGQRVETSTGSTQVERVATTIVGQGFNQHIIVNELTLKFDSILGSFAAGQVLHNIDSEEQVYTTILPVISSVIVNAGGSNYLPDDIVTFSEGPAGGQGYGALGAVAAVASSALNGVSVINGGAGFITGIPVTFTSSTGSGAAAVVSQVVYGELLLEDGSGYLDWEDSTPVSSDIVQLEDVNVLFLELIIQPLITTVYPTARDLGSANRTGTYNGALTRGAAGPFTLDDGTAVTFVSNSQFVSVGGGNFSTTSPFTVEAWIKTSNTTAQQPIFTNNPGATPGSSGLYFGTSSGRLFASSGTGFSGTATVATGAWTHVALTYDGVTMKSYVNGALDNTAAFTFVSNSQPAFVAHSAGNSANTFSGSIDEVAFYTAALSAARILAHYNARTNAFNYRTAVIADTPYLYYQFNDIGVYLNSSDYGIDAGVAQLDGVVFDSAIEIALAASDTKPFMDPWVFTNPGHTTAELANVATMVALTSNTFFVNALPVFALGSFTDLVTNATNASISANVIVSDVISGGPGKDQLYLKQVANTAFIVNGLIWKQDGNGSPQTGTITAVSGSANVVGTNTVFSSTVTPNTHIRFFDGSHHVVRAVVNNTFLQTVSPVSANVTANTWSVVPTGTVTNVVLQAQRYYGKIKAVTLLTNGDHYLTPPVVSADSIDAHAQELFYLQPDPTGNTANNQILPAGGRIRVFSPATLQALQDSGQITKVKILASGVAYTDANGIVVTAIHGGGRVGSDASLTPVIGALTQYQGQFTTSRGFLSADKYLQDGDFYNNYTYVVRVAESFERYRALLLKLLHPAGFHAVGRFVEVLAPTAPTSNVAAASTIGLDDGYPDWVLGDGAMAYWRMNDQQGSTGADSVAVPHPLVINGVVTMQQPDSAILTGNTAFHFDGNTSNFATANLNTNFGNTSFSIEFWANGAYAETNAGFIRNCSAGAFNPGAFQGFEVRSRGTAGHLEFARNDGLGGTPTRLSSSGTLGQYANLWTYYVITYDYSTGRATLYINGAHDANTLIGNAAFTGTANVEIGRGNDGALNTTMDEVALYPRALSAAEVSKHYAMRLRVPGVLV